MYKHFNEQYRYNKQIWNQCEFAVINEQSRKQWAKFEGEIKRVHNLGRFRLNVEGMCDRFSVPWDFGWKNERIFLNNLLQI